MLPAAKRSANCPTLRTAAKSSGISSACSRSLLPRDVSATSPDAAMSAQGCAVSRRTHLGAATRPAARRFATSTASAAPCVGTQRVRILPRARCSATPRVRTQSAAHRVREVAASHTGTPTATISTAVKPCARLMISAAQSSGMRHALRLQVHRFLTTSARLVSRRNSSAAHRKLATAAPSERSRTATTPSAAHRSVHSMPSAAKRPGMQSV